MSVQLILVVPGHRLDFATLSKRVRSEVIPRASVGAALVFEQSN
jgi:hypothetical protein